MIRINLVPTQEISKLLEKERYQKYRFQQLVNKKKHYEEHKEIILERNRKYYAANKEKVLAKHKEWVEKHPGYVDTYNREYFENNKDQIREQNKEYYKKNKEKKSKYNKDYQEKNRDRILEQKKEYWKENKEKIMRYVANRRATDMEYAASLRIRSRMYMALKAQVANKTTHWREFGYTAKELKEHLESLFTEGMSWSNRNLWEIDHIIPISKFDLSIKEEVIRANALSNLQPLWAHDNRRKSNKIIEVPSGKSTDQEFQI